MNPPRLAPLVMSGVHVPPLLRSTHYSVVDSMDPPIIAREIGGVLFDRREHELAGSRKSSSTPDSKRFPKDKLISILDEERGHVGRAAKRLGVSVRRLYSILSYHNIQAREFR